MDKEIINVAIQALDKEIANNPTAQLLKERGRLRMMVCDHEGALADLQQAARMDPDLLAGLSGAFKA